MQQLSLTMDYLQSAARNGCGLEEERKAKTKKTVIDSGYLDRYCNLVPDPRDPRDYQYAALGVPVEMPEMPDRIDLSDETGPVGDQAYTGSCVGWAAAHGLRRWLYFKESGDRLDFSVRFVWMGSKEYDPFDINVPFDLSGTRVRDAFKVMRKFGACPDSLWPFADRLPDPDLEEKIKLESLRYRIGVYHQLKTNEARRVHLVTEGPFVVGVPVYSNWADIGPDGVVPPPAGYPRGGHAVLVVGYDDKLQQFKFQNSWGADWGDDRYGYFPYGYLENHSWSSWGAKQ